MKNVLITAATKGIGFEICKELASNDYNIVIISNNFENLKIAKSKIQSINKKIDCQIYCSDLTNLSKTQSVFNKIKKKHSIDIVINNFGGNHTVKQKKIVDFKNLKNLIESNIYCSYLAISTFIDQMVKKKWGRVITISSSVNQSFDNELNYNFAKSAQVILMKNLSTKKLYLKNNITFNVVSPGAILTETSKWLKISKNNPKVYKKILHDHFPMGFGHPIDIANLVIFLCSDKSKYVNGANVVIDGGRSNFKNSLI